MNALELADALDWVCENHLVGIGDADFKATATMLRQQQAEIEALKMGFANSGTHDSELAETRAMAGRLFLKVQDLEFEQEGYENLTEMLESEKAELTEKNCQQQNEIEDLINAHRFVQNFAEEQHQRAVGLESELDRAVELYTDKAIENEALLKFIDERGETGQLIIWKAQEK